MMIGVKTAVSECAEAKKKKKINKASIMPACQWRILNVMAASLVMYYYVHNCKSPSNDYTAVGCSNNNQAQLHTHVSVSF